MMTPCFSALRIISAALLFSIASVLPFINAASAQNLPLVPNESAAAPPEEFANSLFLDGAPSIVRITCQTSGVVGTAFKHKSGHLLAANSSIRSCTDVMVGLPSGNEVVAEVVARDPQMDLAILMPKAPIPGRPLEIARLQDVPIGTATAAIGYPAAYIGNSAHLFLGYVSGVYRMQISPERSFTKLILGGNYNSGLAGSPLFDKDGNVIGILAGLLSPLSDGTVSALNALKAERGSSFIWQQPDGARIPLSHGQVVAMLLEEILMQGHYLVGLATPLQDLAEFLAGHGIDP
jgi:S1-C subfamily serine protease